MGSSASSSRRGSFPLFWSHSSDGEPEVASTNPLQKVNKIHACKCVINRWLHLSHSYVYVPPELIQLVSMFYSALDLDKWSFDRALFDEGVQVNGRELTVSESAAYSMICGSLVVPMFDGESDVRSEYRYVSWTLTFLGFHRRTYNYFGVIPCDHKGVILYRMKMCESEMDVELSPSLRQDSDSSKHRSSHSVFSSPFSWFGSHSHCTRQPSASQSLSDSGPETAKAWAITFGAAMLMVCTGLRETDVSMVSDQNGVSTLPMSRGLTSEASRFYHPPWTVSDTLKLTVDRMQRTLTVHRNDELLGLAYTNLPPVVRFVVNPFGNIRISMTCEGH